MSDDTFKKAFEEIAATRAEREEEARRIASEMAETQAKIEAYIYRIASMGKFTAEHVANRLGVTLFEVERAFDALDDICVLGDGFYMLVLDRPDTIDQPPPPDAITELLDAILTACDAPLANVYNADTALLYIRDLIETHRAALDLPEPIDPDAPDKPIEPDELYRWEDALAASRKTFGYTDDNKPDAKDTTA
jgi:hypothetical protein